MSDDERVQQVIDELDPTPASEVEWPVSRRQTLRALAAAGLLGAGSGSASAESAGGVIADEAVFSNYGSESVSDGWELTIDDDVFALTESDTLTIGLPDGGVGEELVLPNGVGASEMIAPDGTVVFAIPDSVVSLYEYEDDADTTVAADSVGDNPADISGATYTTTANVGSLALSHDGSEDTTQSQNTVDLAANGSTNGFSISAWVRPRTLSGFRWAVGWGIDSDNFFLIGWDDTTWRTFFQVNGTNSTIDGGSASTDTWYHVYGEVLGDGTQRLKINNTEDHSGASGLDPTNIGPAYHFSGGRIFTGREYADAIIDDFSPANDPLSDSEIQTMIDRA